MTINRKRIVHAALPSLALLLVITFLEVQHQSPDLVGFWIGTKMFGAEGWILSKKPLVETIKIEVDGGKNGDWPIKVYRIAWFVWA